MPEHTQSKKTNVENVVSRQAKPKLRLYHVLLPQGQLSDWTVPSNMDFQLLMNG